ncbi:MAG: 4Fe-4S dicluster domain-containing protein [Chloroflexi bacterium]|nr:4Fe-4S dicluster domain-containing protein [Chloroflexota bacterium]
MTTRMAMYIDASKCTACRGCQVACKQWNELEGWDYSHTVNRGSYENPFQLTPQTWTRIKFTEVDDGPMGHVQWLFLKEGCMHCGDPVCVKVCPTSALKKHEMGIVTFEKELCNGCGYCSQFCPFGIPKMEVVNQVTGDALSSKCVFCQDRTTNGLLPACVKTCPAKALDWGAWDDMVSKAQARVGELEAKGYSNAQVYGDTQIGGLGRIYVLANKPELYGLPANPQYPVLATLWQDIVQPLGGLAIAGTAVALGVNWLIARRKIHVEEEG